MKHHSKQSKDWFSSPFPINTNQFTIDRMMNFENKQNQHDQSNLFKSNIFAPNTPYYQPFGYSPLKNNTPQSENLRISQNQKFKSQQFKYQNFPHNLEGYTSTIDRKLDFGKQAQQDLSHRLDQDEEMITPIKQNKNDIYFQNVKEQNQQIQTTAKKSEINQQNSSRKCRPREKGLRKLSQRAFQIVMALKSVTYKDVATQLVHQLKQQNQLQNQTADEQNVKRRVYDALNVLIASNVLKRDGRKIKLQKRQNECSQQQKLVFVNQLKGNLTLRKFRIKQKKKKRFETIKKFNLIRLLMKRNKQQKPMNKIINFPFIGAFTEQIKQNKIQFETRQQFSVCLKEPTIPFGDIDSIIYLQNSLTKK